MRVTDTLAEFNAFVLFTLLVVQKHGDLAPLNEFPIQPQVTLIVLQMIVPTV